MSEPGQPSGVHFQYNIDLSDPTPENLERIKDELIAKITRNIAAEQSEAGEDPGLEMLNRHDRHYSIHSSDDV